MPVTRAMTRLTKDTSIASNCSISVVPLATTTSKKTAVPRAAKKDTKATPVVAKPKPSKKKPPTKVKAKVPAAAKRGKSKKETEEAERVEEEENHQDVDTGIVFHKEPCELNVTQETVLTDEEDEFEPLVGKVRPVVRFAPLPVDIIMEESGEEEESINEGGNKNLEDELKVQLSKFGKQMTSSQSAFETIRDVSKSGLGFLKDIQVDIRFQMDEASKTLKDMEKEEGTVPKTPLMKQLKGKRKHEETLSPPPIAIRIPRLEEVEGNQDERSGSPSLFETPKLKEAEILSVVPVPDDETANVKEQIVDTERPANNNNTTTIWKEGELTYNLPASPKPEVQAEKEPVELVIPASSIKSKRPLLDESTMVVPAFSSTPNLVKVQAPVLNQTFDFITQADVNNKQASKKLILDSESKNDSIVIINYVDKKINNKIQEPVAEKTLNLTELVEKPLNRTYDFHSDSRDTYNITLYEDFDEENKHRANKKIPEWADNNEDLTRQLLLMGPTLYQKFINLTIARRDPIFPVQRPDFKLFPDVPLHKYRP